MQSYDEVFARVYDRRWGTFAETVCPKLLEFLTSRLAQEDTKNLLDVGCGTGHLALGFLEAGYFVVGLDKSPSMLKHAREKTAKFIDRKQAVFVKANAESFSIDRSFQCAVSTFDALNHLPNLDALRSCFRSVRGCLNDNGTFVFDLNTRVGLLRWAGMVLQDDEEMTVFNRGIFTKEMKQAFNQITGFVRNNFGMYEKFNESFFNTVFDLADVTRVLEENGFDGVYCADIDDLAVPLDEPELAPRVFFVARARG